MRLNTGISLGVQTTACGQLGVHVSTLKRTHWVLETTTPRCVEDWGGRDLFIYGGAPTAQVPRCQHVIGSVNGWVNRTDRLEGPVSWYLPLGTSLTYTVTSLLRWTHII